MNIEAMLAAYIECALWSTTDNADDSGGEPLDKNYTPADIVPEALAKMRADVEKFATEQAEALSVGEPSRSGHDLWLTRNRHGAGFWDGDWPKPQADILTKAAYAMGEVNLYADDGKLYLD